MTEYTDEQLAAMMETYRTYTNYLTFIGNVGSHSVWLRRGERNPLLRYQRDLHRNASYLLRKGIPEMRENIPQGALKRLGIDLKALEERCEELEKSSSQKMLELKRQR